MKLRNSSAELLNRERQFPVRRCTAFLLAAALLMPAATAFAHPKKTRDPGVIKAKVEKLGVGEHVMVKRTQGPNLHGNITAIGQHDFKVRSDKTRAEVQIHYGEVVKIRKNPGPIGWMLVGAVLVIVLIAVATK